MSEDSGNGPAEVIETLAEADVRLVGTIYIELLCRPGKPEILPRMLGHIPQAAASAAAEILESVALNLRKRGSRIVVPFIRV